MLYINITLVYYGNNQKIKLEDCYTCVVIGKSVPSLSTYLATIYEIMLFLNVLGTNAPVALVLLTVLRCRLNKELFIKCFVKNNISQLESEESNSPGVSSRKLKYDRVPLLQEPLLFKPAENISTPLTQYLNLSLCHMMQGDSSPALETVISEISKFLGFGKLGQTEL